MTQVTKDEFYRFIQPFNYVVTGGENKRIIIYKARYSEKVFGKIVEHSNADKRSAGEGAAYFINDTHQ